MNLNEGTETQPVYAKQPEHRGLVGADSAGVVRIAFVHLSVECCQGRLSAPAQTVEVETWD